MCLRRRKYELHRSLVFFLVGLYILIINCGRLFHLNPSSKMSEWLVFSFSCLRLGKGDMLHQLISNPAGCKDSSERLQLSFPVTPEPTSKGHSRAVTHNNHQQQP